MKRSKWAIILYKKTYYVAHCLELDLIGDGNTKDEATVRLKKTIEIQYHIHEEKGTYLCFDADDQWNLLHQAAPLGKPEKTIFDIQKFGKAENTENIKVRVEIDKTPRILKNKDSWRNEYPMHKLIKLLGTKRISWNTSKELDYGYFLGHCPAGSDGPIQSYPFYLPPENLVSWYHLKNIASRFWLDDLTSNLLHENENVES